jgi:fumarate reductase iron-sulfur subunit
MADKITLEVARYSPEQDGAPRFDRYEVPLIENWMVLDALNYIKDQLDGTVTFRWSCRMGICGSCGMVVNGHERLTCETLLADYVPGPIRVEPLRHFPVMRDLVVDLSDFMEKLERVKPWIIRQPGAPEPSREFIQTPEELAQYKQYSLCINCVLCYSACPVYGLDPHFIGPAASALSLRYNLDSRDQGAEQRLDVMAQHDGVWDCTVIGECSVVCPKHVDPSLAIQEYKISATKAWFKNLLMPRGGK